MPSINGLQNVFDDADFNENIDETVEEIELEIEPINPADFEFGEETETSYSEKTQRDRLLENREQIAFRPAEIFDMNYYLGSIFQA